MTAATPSLIAYSVAYLALSWVVAVGAIALAWVHPAIYTIALAVLLVSSRQQALLNLEHEAIHRKFLPWPRANAFVGRFLCAGPGGSPYGASQARHVSHHRLLARLALIEH